LEETGQLVNTIAIFKSDNGYFEANLARAASGWSIVNTSDYRSSFAIQK